MNPIRKYDDFDTGPEITFAVMMVIGVLGLAVGVWVLCH
jgi:hypothetical protein